MSRYQNISPSAQTLNPDWSLSPRNISLYHLHQHPTTIMPICINCTQPIQTLYTTYSKADDKTLGKGVRLTQCPRCKGFADKYVEHDFVVLFIDLVLIRPQVSGAGGVVMFGGREVALAGLSAVFLAVVFFGTF